jgi:hypothetical protein
MLKFRAEYNTVNTEYFVKHLLAWDSSSVAFDGNNDGRTIENVVLGVRQRDALQLLCRF